MSTDLRRPIPEVGVFSPEIGGTVVKVTEHWLVVVTPMIFNDRVVLAPHDWYGGFTAGWCYDKGPGAMLAALVWDPETEPRPAGFKKEAYDAR